MGAAVRLRHLCCFLCLSLSVGATACPPIPSTAMAGQRSTTNATELAAREVAATLRRDAPTPGAAADVLAAVLRSRDDFVMVLDNRVFVDRAFLTKSKHAAHAAFVAAVARRRRLPNVAYRFSAGTRGVKRAGCRPVPLAVIAKVGGHAQCGALVPNPYFGPDLDAWDAAQPVAPFATRSSKTLWRGNISARPCDRDGGNRARLAAGALSLARPDLFDAGCPHVAGCAPRDPDQCGTADTGVAKAYGGDAFPPEAATPAMRRAARSPATLARGYVDQTRFAAAKYLLHLPGAFTGSYSRNLNGLWRRGSVVLLWAAAYAEFYFPALEEGRTHLVVDACSAPEVVEALNADPRRAEALAAAAWAVHDSLLCADCLARYFLSVVSHFRRHYALGPVLDRADDRRQLADCPSLDLLEVRGARPWRDPYGRALPNDRLDVRSLSVGECEELFVK